MNKLQVNCWREVGADRDGTLDHLHGSNRVSDGELKLTASC